MGHRMGVQKAGATRGMQLIGDCLGLCLCTFKHRTIRYPDPADTLLRH